MSPRKPPSFRRPLLSGALCIFGVIAASSAQADGLYSITGLGTLQGQSSSVATSINNSGQVVGISYNSSDGYFGPYPGPASASPLGFNVTGTGAMSFIYNGGQISQINPTGGLANSINNAGQVAGGNTSINDSGQYVTGTIGGVYPQNLSNGSQLVTNGTTTNLPPLFGPYAINNSGQIAGYLIVNVGHSNFDPAIYQNGQVTDLVSKVASGAYYDGRAIAINQKGDALITVQQSAPLNGLPAGQAGPLNSYLYNAGTGQMTNLTALPGGTGLVAAALNDKDQAVGNGFLYSNGSLKSLLSVLPAGSGWSYLTATGINDSGQIVGQGTFNGQLEAFEMTPNAQQVPEPASVVVWCVATTAAAIAIGVRQRRGEANQNNK